jgi:hypothetical protein
MFTRPQHWSLSRARCIQFTTFYLISLGLGIFLFTTTTRPALGPTQPPIQWVTGSISLGLNRPGSEADYSTPSSAEIKNAWSYTSTPQYVFMAWCLVKHGDNFTFTYTVLILPSHLVNRSDLRDTPDQTACLKPKLHVIFSNKCYFCRTFLHRCRSTGVQI